MCSVQVSSISDAPVSVANSRICVSISAGGRNRYTWSGTGLDAVEVRERVSAYQDRFGVPIEQLR
jgi:hypothetical protein